MLGYKPNLGNGLILNQIQGPVLALSMYKLRSGYTGNCIRIRRSDDNTESNIGFNANKKDDFAIRSFLERNLENNPTLAIDSNVDGLADGWNGNINGVTTVTYSIDGGQKILITNANQNGASATTESSLYPACATGMTFTLEFEYYTSNCYARIASVTSPSSLIPYSSGSLESEGVWTKVTTNFTYPSTTDTNLRVILGARAKNVGDTGFVRYRNIFIKKTNLTPIVVTIYDQTPITYTDNLEVINPTLTIDVGGNGVADGYASGTFSSNPTTFSIDGGQKIAITSSTDTGYSRIYTATAITANPNDVINLSCQYKTTGNVRVDIRISPQTSSGTGITDYTQTGNASVDFTNITITNQTMPTTTAKFLIQLRVYPINAGDTGSVIFKNVLITKQLTGGCDAVQTVANSQPKIVNNGVILDSPYFDGIDDWMKINNTSNALNLTQALTEDMIIKAEGSGYIFVKNNETFSNVQYGTTWDGADKFENKLNGSSSAYLSNVYAKNINLHHIFTYNKVKAETTVNDNLDNSVSYNLDLVNRDHAGIGSRSNSVDGLTRTAFFKGYLKHLCLYSVALNSTQKRQLYNDAKKKYSLGGA